MRRLWLGLVLGLVIGTLVHAEERKARFEEVPISTANNETFQIPPEYGHLVNAAVRADVHYLYFEASDGTVRIVLVGPRGAIQRARNELQLLTPEILVIKRGRESVS